MYTKFYQNRLVFVEDMAKTFWCVFLLVHSVCQWFCWVDPLDLVFRTVWLFSLVTIKNRDASCLPLGHWQIWHIRRGFNLWSDKYFRSLPCRALHIGRLWLYLLRCRCSVNSKLTVPTRAKSLVSSLWKLLLLRKKSGRFSAYFLFQNLHRQICRDSKTSDRFNQKASPKQNSLDWCTPTGVSPAENETTWSH